LPFFPGAKSVLFVVSSSHWLVAIKILNYLASTKSLGLDVLVVLLLAQATPKDCRSTSDYTYRFGNMAISWKSHKQATVSLYSTKPEYKALADSCKECLWLCNVQSPPSCLWLVFLDYTTPTHPLGIMIFGQVM
jgi:hypothetical protein